MEKLLKFLKDEEGIVAIEYALIAIGVAVGIAAVTVTLGGHIVNVFQRIINALG